MATMPSAGTLSPRRVKRRGIRRVWAIVLGTIAILLVLLVAFPYQFGWVSGYLWGSIKHLFGQ